MASEENLDNGDYHYYIQNGHGEIEYITGTVGKVENAYTYDSFGKITNSTELVRNRYTYNGEQYDQGTQQYYLRARYYNPLVGRFTQKDTYYGDGLNLYAYCRNFPIGYTDLSGHYPCKDKQDLYNEYREKGYKTEDANIMANYELIRKKQGVEVAEKYLQEQKIK